jgi:phosphoglycerate dehydrogenase-like enzyme
LKFATTDAAVPNRPKLAFAFDPAHAGDVISPDQLQRLRSFCDVIDPAPMQDFSGGRAVSNLSQASVLLTGWGCPAVDRSVLALAPNLRLVAHAAGSVKGFVRPEVFEAGILVTNAAAADAIPVAEFTLAAILFANKNVFGFRDMYRDRRDSLHARQFTGSTVGNRRKTIGIVGLSRIGRRVLELLRPFDLDVIVHDPHLADTEAQALRVRNVGLDEVMRCCDIVTLHAPALDQTRHMIDARRLALMRDGSTLINTARGSLVDQGALIRDLSLGRIAAVLDVTDPDDLPADSPLFDLPNVFLTPHIAGALGTERERLGILAVEEVERFARAKPLEYQVHANTLHLQA